MNEQTLGAASAPDKVVPEQTGELKTRSQMYVKRQFQQSMVLEVLLLTFIMINMIVIVAYWMMDSISDLHTMKQYLAYTIGGMEIIGFIAIYKINLEASHRIAGPIFNLERCLRRMQNGELDFTMKLRSKDQFQEMAAEVNETMGSIGSRIASARQLAERIRDNPQQSEELAQQLIDELAHFKTNESSAPGSK